MARNCTRKSVAHESEQRLCIRIQPWKMVAQVRTAAEPLLFYPHILCICIDPSSSISIPTPSAIELLCPSISLRSRRCCGKQPGVTGRGLTSPNTPETRSLAENLEITHCKEHLS